MIARCLRGFNDLEKRCWRDVGDEWEVSPERFKELNSTRYGELVQEVKEKPVKSKKATKE